jgi:capsular polysaccharide biosynthesis protein
VLSGFSVALALALLSYVRVSADGLSYRKPEIWSNEATLILSDPSHPELRSTLVPTVDPNRFAALVEEYAEFATSDAVITSLEKQGLLSRKPDPAKLAKIVATPVYSVVNGGPTPLLKISGLANSPAAATRLTLRATNTFIDVAKARQAQANIPASQRIELRTVKRLGVPKLVGPRSKTGFIMVLLAGLTMTVAAAFLRENLQRQTDRKAESDEVSNRDRLVREAEPPASTATDALRAAAENGSPSVTNGTGGLDAPVRSVADSRRRAHSSG